MKQGMKLNQMLTIFLFFLGSYLFYMEVPRLVVKLELQLLAYAAVTATTTPDLSCI